MCDEYYDARMKAFWRVIAEESELDEENEEEVVQPILLPVIEPTKPKAKLLAH